MHKWLLVSCLAVGLTLGTAGLQSAKAQFGYGAHCPPHGHYGHHSHHSHHGHYGYYGGYTRPSLGYSSYSLGYAPYGLGGVYGSSLRYGSYYGAPGLSIGRSSFYSGGLPYGVGGFGVPGIGYPPAPGLQLRIGF